jgi:hypothetical protein
MTMLYTIKKRTLSVCSVPIFYKVRYVAVPITIRLAVQIQIQHLSSDSQINKMQKGNYSRCEKEQKTCNLENKPLSHLPGSIRKVSRSPSADTGICHRGVVLSI